METLETLREGYTLETLETLRAGVDYGDYGDSEGGVHSADSGDSCERLQSLGESGDYGDSRLWVPTMYLVTGLHSLHSLPVGRANEARSWGSVFSLLLMVIEH